MKYHDVQRLQTILSESINYSIRNTVNDTQPDETTSPSSSSQISSSSSSSLLFLTSYPDTIPYCTDWTKQFTFPHPLSNPKNIPSNCDAKNRHEPTSTWDTTDDTTHYSSNSNSNSNNTVQQPTLCVAQPRTIQQLVQIVKYCYRQHIPILPLGGRTGLVGGTIPSLHPPPPSPPQIMMTTMNPNPKTTAIPNQDYWYEKDQNHHHNSNSNKNDDDDVESIPRHLSYPLELFVSTQYLRDNITDQTHLRMTNNSGILQCGAGYTLQEVQDYARHLHPNPYSTGISHHTNGTAYTVPIDIGSKGTCTMGRIVATIAGGPYYYRYQSLLTNIIGLQCVTGTGTILNWNYDNVDRCSTSTTTNTTAAVNFKDNTGYKLYPLLIGSEGTLGISPVLEVRKLCINKWDG